MKICDLKNQDFIMRPCGFGHVVYFLDSQRAQNEVFFFLIPPVVNQSTLNNGALSAIARKGLSGAEKTGVLVTRRPNKDATTPLRAGREPFLIGTFWPSAFH